MSVFLSIFPSQMSTSGSVEARSSQTIAFYQMVWGVWVNSSSRWVVTSASSLAARLSFWVPPVLRPCGSLSAGSLAARLSFWVLAVWRLGDPGHDFVWVCDDLHLPME